MTDRRNIKLVFCIYWCVVFASSASLERRSTRFQQEQKTSHDLYVGEDSRFCQYTHSLLHCDFKWTPETVYLEERPKSKGNLNAVLIRQVHDLVVNRSVCIDLALTHVSRVKIEGQKSDTCSRMGLSLRNVTLDALRDPVTSVYADESHIRNLSLNSLAGQLTVIGSKVDVLNIPEVAESDVSLKIHSTTIKKFEQLRISKPGGGSFLLQNSIVETISPKALVLEISTGNLISGVQFPESYDLAQASVSLSNGADLTMEDISGTVKIFSPPYPNEMAVSSFPDGDQENPLLRLNTSETERETERKKEKTRSDWWIYFLFVLVNISMIMNVMLILLIYRFYVTARKWTKDLMEKTEEKENQNEHKQVDIYKPSHSEKENSPLLHKKYANDNDVYIKVSNGIKAFESLRIMRISRHPMSLEITNNNNKDFSQIYPTEIPRRIRGFSTADIE